MKQTTMLKLVEVVSKDPKDDEEIIANLENRYFNVGSRTGIEARMEKIREAKRVLPWINKGFRVINLIESFRKTGGFPPYIALCRLFDNQNYQSVFEHERNGESRFVGDMGTILRLPEGTLKPHIPFSRGRFVTEAPLVEKWRVESVKQMLKPELETWSRRSLENDTLLAWEARDWKEIPLPDLDPLILQMVETSGRNAAVLQAWDITPVEHVFMRQILESTTSEVDFPPIPFQSLKRDLPDATPPAAAPQLDADLTRCRCGVAFSRTRCRAPPPGNPSDDLWMRQVMCPSCRQIFTPGQYGPPSLNDRVWP